MIQWILSNIVCHEFDERIGKHHRFKGDSDAIPAMHIAWEITPHCEEEQPNGEQEFQYKRIHMILCGPGNYVYVATQEEVIDMAGEQHFGQLNIICFHDSCWRDSVQRFICDNASRLSQAQSSEHLMGWNDRLELSKAEVDYLSKVESWRLGYWKKKVQPPELVAANPIQKRWVH